LLASAVFAGVSAQEGVPASAAEVAPLTTVPPGAPAHFESSPENLTMIAARGTPDLRACALQQDPRQRPVRQAATKRSRQSRMFGWLWRSTRNIDIERTGAPMLFYLRSPLLTALPERADCPHEMMAQEPRELANCASLAVNSGSEDAYSVAVSLPQLAAGSPAKLGDTLRGRLERGTPVTLRALGGAEIEFSPDRVRQVEARACTADA
jgi:hypothetical protein